jgi:regulator of cell morphogenesis and NO signaling
LSFPDVLARLADAEAAPLTDSRDWAKESLTALARHIVAAYHEPLREELPHLEAMAAKVASVHGAGAPYLSRVKAIVLELSAELRSHMQKEEIVLFPAIEALESQSKGVMPLNAPITVMEDEHDYAGALLAELRAITRGYEVPDWGCGTFQALYRGLDELESMMHVHIHLENNILFPRALAAPTARVPA